MNIPQRIAMEKRIVVHLIKELIARGYLVSLDDGEGVAVSRSSDIKDFMSEIASTDEQHIIVHSGDLYVGKLYLVYGNDGYDVINDYSVRLEDDIKETRALCDKLERETL